MPAADTPPNSGFIPPRITSPQLPLGPLATVAAIKRSPIEALPRGAFTGPYVEQILMGRQLLWLTDPDGLKTVLLEQPENFPKGFVQKRVLRPITGDGLLTSEGAHWKWQRRAAAPQFTPGKTLAFVPIFATAAATALDRFRAMDESGRIDVLEVMTATTFKVIGDALLSGEGGIDIDRFAAALARYKATIGRASWLDVLGLPAWVPRPSYVTGFVALRRIRSMATSLVKHRQDRRTRDGAPEKPDLLDLLLSASDPESGRVLNPRELTDNVVTLATAGHETTTLALTFALYLLALHPEAQERAAAEACQVLGDGSGDGSEGREAKAEDVAKLVFTKQVIEEAMRLYTPTPIMTRTARQATEVSGVKIKAGGHIALALYALHRHEALWDNPNSFDPDRFSPERSKGRHRFQYLPFGGGPRVCIGATFAMAEAAVILATVLREFSFAPVPGHELRLKHVITLRPEGGMPLIVRPRNS